MSDNDEITINQGSGKIINLGNENIKCIFCQNPCDRGLALHKNNNDELPMLNMGEAAHLECYLKMCVQHFVGMH